MFIDIVMKIIAVIPAYNEEKFIGDVIKRTLKYIDKVIVVDDCSRDNTFKVARKAGAEVIRHKVNRGKWAALKTGFRKALEDEEVEIIIQLDGDGQHDPDEIPSFINAIKNADVVIGKRIYRGKMPLIRKFSNFITTFLLRKMFGVNVSDSQCGYRAYRRKVLEKLNFKSTGFEGETETLILIHRLGFKIIETPIKTIYGEEKSKVKTLRDAYRFIKTLISMKFK